MSRNCKMPHVDIIRDNVWVDVSSGDANKIVVSLAYYREAGGCHDAKTYVLSVCALNTKGARMVYWGRSHLDVWHVANRRSVLNDGRAVSIARDYVRKMVRDIAASCGADADKAADDAMALIDNNW